MRYSILRPLLFALPPETAHALTLGALQLTGRLPRCEPPPPPPPVILAGLTFPNRVGLAAGFDKSGVAVDGIGRLGFGFLEIGTVTPKAQPGNPSPRVFRLPRSRALINRLGFPNDGADFVAARLRRRRYRGVLGVNIGKNAATPNERAVDDYLQCFETLHSVVGYIAVNVSSPNTANLRDLQQADHLGPILEALVEARARVEKTEGRRIPLFVKISPDLDGGDIAEMAGVIDALGLDGVIATNTTIGRDTITDEPLASEPGGLSGAPLLPLTLATIRRVRSALPRTTIIGCGGILTGGAAVEMRRAGADLVQIYTGLVYRGPRLVAEAATALAVADQRPGHSSI